MGISKIATKTAEAFSTAGKKITKTINAQKSFKTTMENCKGKLSHDLDALASVNKAKTGVPERIFHDTITVANFYNGKTYKLAAEGVYNGGLTAEKALRGAKEVMAATKMSNVPKSAMESAEVFKEFGETTAEKVLKQQELKAELMKKHGEKLPEIIKQKAEKQARAEKIKNIALENIKLHDLFEKEYN